MYTQDFQERKKFERYFYSWASILATSIFLVVVIFSTIKLLRKERVEIAEIAVLDQKIEETKLAQQKNTQKLKSLDTEVGIEEQARGKFNLKKEGEEMVVFLDGSPETQRKAGFWANAEASSARIWQNLKNWLHF